VSGRGENWRPGANGESCNAALWLEDGEPDCGDPAAWVRREQRRCERHMEEPVVGMSMELTERIIAMRNARRERQLRVEAENARAYAQRALEDADRRREAVEKAADNDKALANIAEMERRLGLRT
jgi:hypothetical protein